MTAQDPNVRWDGQQWIRWDGGVWQPMNLPAAAYAPPPPAGFAVGAYPSPGGPGYITDQKGKSVQATFAWIFAVLTLGYMLPWAIAATRGKSNAGMIGILNFFVGWTVIGWIIALVMACSAHQIAGSPATVNVMTAVGYPPTYPPAPYGQPYVAPYPQSQYPGQQPSQLERPEIVDGGSSR